MGVIAHLCFKEQSINPLASHFLHASSLSLPTSFFLFCLIDSRRKGRLTAGPPLLSSAGHFILIIEVMRPLVLGLSRPPLPILLSPFSGYGWARIFFKEDNSLFYFFNDLSRPALYYTAKSSTEGIILLICSLDIAQLIICNLLLVTISFHNQQLCIRHSFSPLSFHPPLQHILILYLAKNER